MDAALLLAAQRPTALRSSPHRLIDLFRTCHSPSPMAGKFHDEPFLRGPLTALLPLAVVLFIRLHCRDSIDVSLRLRQAEREPRRIDGSLRAS